ncbi:MAG: hypothetical protein VYA69_09195 [Gemmatimonadota bacterium]|nr:hypothetical protein [Gemmatimonadota bacterium]
MSHATGEMAQTIADVVPITTKIGGAGQSSFGAADRCYANTEKVRQIGISQQIALTDGKEEMVAGYRETD